MEFDEIVTHSIDIIMGKPKSGKTLLAGSYPKPLLYISVGADGGGRVLNMAYREDVTNGNIKVKNLTNDPVQGGKIARTSIEKLAMILAELRKPGSMQFKTVVVDTVSALQDDYKAYLEFSKGGRQLSQQEWGDVSKMVLNIKDNMKRFAEETRTQLVWITHTSEQELYETSGLNKEIRIIPDLTIKTGIKFMKDASNIFYCCRKTIIEPNGEKSTKFLTYIGPHPLMDTGTRDLLLTKGFFAENLTYAKWQDMVNGAAIKESKVFTTENVETNNEKKDEE